jgi:hypothetical protein
MTYVDRHDFFDWAYSDLLANTTRGVLAEYIVAKALGILDRKRVEWDRYDLRLGTIGIEVKSAAYVQSWKTTQPSTIAFDIGPKAGWDAETNTSAASAGRAAHVYVFCLLEGMDRNSVSPLDLTHWRFYVLPTSVLNREVPKQKTIRLGPLLKLGPTECTFDGLKDAVDCAALRHCAESIALTTLGCVVSQAC